MSHTHALRPWTALLQEVEADGIVLLSDGIDVDALRKELSWLHWMELVLLFLYEEKRRGKSTSSISSNDDDSDDAFIVEDIVGMCSKLDLPS